MTVKLFFMYLANGNNTKRGRPRHPVWEHFSNEGKAKSGFHSIAKCLYCAKQFPRAKIPKLRLHVAFECSKAPIAAKSQVIALSEGDENDSDNDKSAASASAKKFKVTQQQSLDVYFASTATTKSMGKEMKQYFDRKLEKMLVCCNIPFRAVDSPVFRSFVSALHPGYVPPSSSHVRESLFWDEAARVVRDSTNELKQDRNLTLAIDGWTDVGKSLYAYVIITSDRRVYLHALKDFSAAFLTSETVKVIEEIGHEHIAAVVTDNAANMRKLRQNICDKHQGILGLRCMPHLINLVAQDIMKHEWARNVLKSCQTVVNYFGSHHRQKALLVQCRSEDNPELSGFVATRWYSAGNCIQSVVKNEEPLKKTDANERL